LENPLCSRYTHFHACANRRGLRGRYPMMRWILTTTLGVAILAGQVPSDYKVLATSRTSTMEREMNEAAAIGYSFLGTMGGESAFGGKETIVIMGKTAAGKKRYKLLATSKTGTMQKELGDAGDEGFAYKGQTVFESAFGGREVCVILERDTEAAPGRFEYKLLATSKTSTMEKELREAGTQGFEFLGVSIGKTAFGGNEVVSILVRPKK
jgi:hypothetical protein